MFSPCWKGGGLCWALSLRVIKPAGHSNKPNLKQNENKRQNK